MVRFICIGFYPRRHCGVTRIGANLYLNSTYPVRGPPAIKALYRRVSIAAGQSPDTLLTQTMLRTPLCASRPAI